MPDRKNVLAELENIQKFFEARVDMAVGAGKIRLLAYANAARDARELLKEQEPVEPVFVGDVNSAWWYGCGACNRSIDPLDMFCRYCGRRVK